MAINLKQQEFLFNFISNLLKTIALFLLLFPCKYQGFTVIPSVSLI